MTVDQLHDGADIDGPLWQELIDGLEESAVIELIMLVGISPQRGVFLTHCVSRSNPRSRRYGFLRSRRQ